MVCALAALFSSSLHLRDHLFFHSLTFAFVTAAFGGQQIVFLKALSTMIRDSTSHPESFSAASSSAHTFWIAFYVVLAISLGVAQLSFISQGCSHFEGVLFLPLYQGMFLVFCVLFGSIYYREFRCFDATAWIMFSFGFSLALIGVVLLSRHREQLAKSIENKGEEQDALLSASKVSQ
eukprot:c12043_g1_i4.p1 GENE.c12043_g1_i4~~c12043_g1_i4.p1  ORF type:complete len:178 (-),score=36.79 c12043_g1_i4:6-539(-)